MTTNGSNEPRDIAVPKYFRRTPEKPQPPRSRLIIGLVILALGILSFFLAVNYWIDSWGIGLAILGSVVGLKILHSDWSNKKEYSEVLKKYEEEYAQTEPKPSDKQMDTWLSEDIAKLTRAAMQELDLDPDDIQQDPIIVTGPSPEAAVAIGKDGVVRFSKYDVVIVFLTEYHLAAYHATLNMATGTPTRETTQEYHYSDIVSVFTKTESSKQ